MLQRCSFIALIVSFMMSICIHALEKETFILDIYVPMISRFSLNLAVPSIKNGLNVLGRFQVENNTRDGFSISISSKNNSHLSPISSEDGEENIPYFIHLQRIAGTLSTTTIENTTPLLTMGETSILSNTLQDAVTNLSYRIYLTLDDSSHLLKMAGSYSDEITIKYTDI